MNKRGTRLFRIVRWYLLLIELVVVVLGIVKLTSGINADQRFGLFMVIFGGFALLCHFVASIAMYRNRQKMSRQSYPTTRT